MDRVVAANLYQLAALLSRSHIGGIARSFTIFSVIEELIGQRCHHAAIEATIETQRIPLLHGTTVSLPTRQQREQPLAPRS